MKKVLIADSHPIIREGIKQILSEALTEVEFGEIEEVRNLLPVIKRSRWDILILDINMLGRNGLEIIRQLQNEKTGVPILAFSNHPEKHYAIRAFKAGVSGYLAKSASRDELIKATRKLISGRKYITDSVAEQIAEQIGNGYKKSPHEELSDREFQILLNIASGKTVSQIGKELSLSVTTISTYRARILKKMRMKTSAELTNYAIRNELV